MSAVLSPKKTAGTDPGASKSTKSVRVALDIHATANKAAPQAGQNLRAFIEPMLWACVKKVEEEVGRRGEDATTSRAESLKHLEDGVNLGSFNVDPGLAKSLAKLAGRLQTSTPKLIDPHLRPLVELAYRKSVASEAVRLHLMYTSAEAAPRPSYFVGPVSAGTGVEVFDNAHDRIDLAEELGGEGRYVFVVRGDSMEDERIFAGDNVIVQREPEPKEGDVVVVRYDRNLLLKKLVRHTDRETRVVSRNAKKPADYFILDPNRGDMLVGKFVAVYRKAK